MVENFSHDQIIRAIEQARISALIDEKGSWAALISVSCAGMTVEQKECLIEHLVGFMADGEVYQVMVADNHHNPIQFENEEAARDQARKLGASLITKYCFSVYSQTGLVIQYIQKPTIHFMPGRSKNT